MAVDFYPVEQPGSDLSFPWAFMTKHGHGANWGGNGQRVVERMIINWEDYADMTAQSELCGYARIDSDTPPGLVRYAPWSHPQWPQLFIDENNGITNSEPTGRPVKVDGEPGAGPYVQYPYVILTLVFTERRYSVLAIPPFPTQPTNPPYPFIEFMDKGTAEYLALSTGSYEYDPDNAAVKAAGLGGGKSFKQGLAVIVSKDTLTFTWHMVPHKWLHNTLGIMSNVLDCLGKVNFRPFFGFPAGTLYFDSHDKERKQYPISVQADGQVPSQDITDTWAWNVTLYFKYRNPPPGDPDVLGHNLGPAPQIGNGKWYPILSKTTTYIIDPVTGNKVNTRGQPLYPYIDFAKIFQKAP